MMAQEKMDFLMLPGAKEWKLTESDYLYSFLTV